MRFVHTEIFRGEELRRNEHPLHTHHWLERRVELSQKEVSRARAVLADADREGVARRGRDALRQAVQDAEEAYRHAGAMRTAFAKRWSPGAGYADPREYESNQPKPPRAASPTREVLPSPKRSPQEEKRLARPDQTPTGGRAAPGEDDAAEGVEKRKPRVQAKIGGKEAVVPSGTARKGGAHPSAASREEEPGEQGRASPAGSPASDAEERAAEEAAPPRTLDQTETSDSPSPGKSYKGLKNTPPDEHKFRKGERSPNPRGRPKGSKNLKSAVGEVFGQTIKIKDPRGRKRTVNVVTALLQLNLHKALAGDAKALKALLPLLREHWNEEPPPTTNALNADERAILTNVLALQSLLGESGEEGLS